MMGLFNLGRPVTKVFKTKGSRKVRGIVPKDKFGALIYYGRQQKRLSMGRAAQAIGVSRQRWHQMERGQYPRGENLEKIANLLGIDVDLLNLAREERKMEDEWKQSHESD